MCRSPDWYKKRLNDVSAADIFLLHILKNAALANTYALQAHDNLSGI